MAGEGDAGNDNEKRSDVVHDLEPDASRDRPFTPLNSQPSDGGSEHPSAPRGRLFHPKSRRLSSPTPELRASELVKRARSGDEPSRPEMTSEQLDAAIAEGEAASAVRQQDHDRKPALMQALYCNVNHAVHEYDALRDCMSSEPIITALKTAPKLDAEPPRHGDVLPPNNAWLWVRQRVGRQLDLHDETTDYRQPHETQKFGLAAWFNESGERSTPPITETNNPPDYSAGFHPKLSMRFAPSIRNSLVTLDPVRPKGAANNHDERFGFYDQLTKWLDTLRTQHSQGELFSDGTPSPAVQTCERAIELTNALRALDAAISSDIAELQQIEQREQARKT